MSSATREPKAIVWLEYMRMVAGGGFVGCSVGAMMSPEASSISAILGAAVFSYLFLPAEGAKPNIETGE